MRNLLSAVGYVDSLSEVARIMKVTVEKSRARSVGCSNCLATSLEHFNPPRAIEKNRRNCFLFFTKFEIPKRNFPRPRRSYADPPRQFESNETLGTFLYVNTR